jgi:hypothetical protein
MRDVLRGKLMKSAPFGETAWDFLFDAIHHRGQLTAYLRPMGGTVPFPLFTDRRPTRGPADAGLSQIGGIANLLMLPPRTDDDRRSPDSIAVREVPGTFRTSGFNADRACGHGPPSPAETGSLGLQ